MYALIANGAVAQFPYSIQQFRQDHTNVSLPAEPTQAQLEEVGVYEVQPSTPPIAAANEKVVQVTPSFDGTTCTQEWDVVEMTAEEIAAKNQQLYDSIVAATLKRLDDFAKTRNYGSIISACTYATSSVTKFRTEAEYCVSARDATWTTLYQLLDDVNNGVVPAPASFADVEPLLPPLAWPN